jgi:uncharacterized protein (TIGR00156 family)
MKKKRFVFLCGLPGILLAIIGLTIYAQQGGYKGPGATALTVAEVKNLRDDAPVTLRGKIEQYLGDEKYLFSDNTGKIVVEIDKIVWGRIEVDQNDSVEITGKIGFEFSWSHSLGVEIMEVKVKTIRKI